MTAGVLFHLVLCSFCLCHFDLIHVDLIDSSFIHLSSYEFLLPLCFIVLLGYLHAHTGQSQTVERWRIEETRWRRH